MNNYPDFVLTTGYGTVTGLKGANCRHDFSPFIPGISVPRYTEEQLQRLKEEEEATKPYPFKNRQGETYTKDMTYRDQLDHQRYMERQMRKTRLKINTFKDLEGQEMYTKSLRIRYRAQLQEYKKFSSTMQIDPNMERIYVDGLGRIG